MVSFPCFLLGWAFEHTPPKGPLDFPKLCTWSSPANCISLSTLLFRLQYWSKSRELSYWIPPHTVITVINYVLCWPFPSSRIQVRLGEHNIDVLEGTEEFIESEKQIPHPGYNPRNMDNDIMLIKLATPATLSSRIRAISLPSKCVAAGTECLISGWGNTLSDGCE